YAPRPLPIELSLDAANHLRWNGVPLPLGAVAAQLQVFSTLPAQQRPTVRLRTTGDTDYQALSEVMVAVDNAGLMSGLGIDADD
ncbi:ExbD/TolR family protein, partial [Stenotrophomonas sp. P5_B8]